MKDFCCCNQASPNGSMNEGLDRLTDKRARNKRFHSIFGFRCVSLNPKTAMSRSTARASTGSRW